MDQPKIVGREFFYAHPVPYTREFLRQVVSVEISTRQFRLERASLIHEQQPVSIDGGNPSDGIFSPAFCSLLEPIAPAKLFKITVPVCH
jgi:hypothetical protein